MPGPKNQELGIRSPKRLRGGIDFPSWEGVSRQNDPGAIRDTQLYTGINVRLNGNEIINRGGMTKIMSGDPMVGCVYGFIDVPEGATSLLLVAHGDGTPDEARLDRYYSEADPVYNTAYPQGVSLQPVPSDPGEMANADLPRRSLTRYNGGLYQFGQDADANPTLFQVILPERTTTLTGNTSVENQIKLEAKLQLPEFASAVERKERFSSTLLTPVLYVGSVSTGKVYRYDGVSLAAETSNLSSKRHIVANFQEDVYAVSQDKISQRGFDGLWSTQTALGVTKTWCAAQEYQTKLYIGGDEAMVSFDGTSIVDLTAALFAVCFDIGVVVDIKCFQQDVYFWVSVENGVTEIAQLVKYDGSIFTLVATFGTDGPVFAGCLEPLGELLWFTYKDNENSIHAKLQWWDGSSVGGNGEGPSDDSEPVMGDMVAF